MFRATRTFIQQRQPHTAFAVAAVATRPWPESVPGATEQDRVRELCQRDSSVQACRGWRVHAYDSEQDLTRISPTWFAVTDAGRQFWHMDQVESAESVIDQAVAVYYRGGVENLPNQPRDPCDVLLKSGDWWLDRGGVHVSIPNLSQHSICSETRATAIVLLCSS